MNIKDFDLASFSKASDRMISKNNESWDTSFDLDYFKPVGEPRSLKEINDIITSGSPAKKRELSRESFQSDGIYKRILMYYATLLTYRGILIPHPSFGTKLSTTATEKRYISALNYLDKFLTKEILTKWTLSVLVDGAYYGVIRTFNKNELVIIDLPPAFCRSRFKDIYGNDLIEFNVAFFDEIRDLKDRNSALSAYPREIESFYKKYRKGKTESSWVKLPGDIGISFSFTEQSAPLFLSVIPSTVRYDNALEVEQERDLEEIRKIIIQKIPHLSDGTLVFEPDEAAEMHVGTVGMMKNNKNVSVLTTYADVDSIVSHTAADSVSNTIDKMKGNIYSEAGVSSEIFAPTGGQSLGTSITNDTSLMMILGNKYSRFLTYILNKTFGNQSLRLSYEILPVTLYNQFDYTKQTLSLAQSGYSFLIPAISMGISQKDLIDLKDLENNALKLNEILIPLSSSFTQSKEDKKEDKEEEKKDIKTVEEEEASKPGAPKKDVEEKAEKTLENEESLDNQGGSN